jgi:hypothetical protein
MGALIGFIGFEMEHRRSGEIDFEQMSMEDPESADLLADFQRERGLRGCELVQCFSCAFGLGSVRA